jgi:hypothetical protein
MKDLRVNIKTLDVGVSQKNITVNPSVPNIVINKQHKVIAAPTYNDVNIDIPGVFSRVDINALFNPIDVIYFEDKLQFTLSKVVSEFFFVRDEVLKSLNKTFTDNVTITDIKYLSISKPLADIVTFEDTVDVVLIKPPFNTTFTVTDEIVAMWLFKEYFRDFNEIVTFTESFTFSFNKNIIDVITFNELLKLSISTSRNDIVTFTDTPALTLSKVFTDIVNFTDEIFADLEEPPGGEQTFNETFSFSESGTIYLQSYLENGYVEIGYISDGTTTF